MWVMLIFLIVGTEANADVTRHVATVMDFRSEEACIQSIERVEAEIRKKFAPRPVEFKAYCRLDPSKGSRI